MKAPDPRHPSFWSRLQKLVFMIAILSVPTRASDPTISRLNAEATDLFEKVSLLVKRARYQRGGPAPTLQEVLAFEEAWLSFKVDLESELNKTPATLNQQAKSAYIQYYLDRLADLANVRVSLHLEHGQEWQLRTSLVLSPTTLQELPGVLGGSVSSGLKTTEAFAYITEALPNGMKRVRLSQTRLQAIELSLLAEKPDSSSFRALIQFLAISQLHQNLQDLESVLPPNIPRLPSPRFPETLRTKIQSLGALPALETEHRNHMREALLRPAFLITGDTTCLSLPALNTPTLSSETARLLGHGVLAAELNAAYKVELEKNWISNLHPKIVGAPMLLGSLSPEEINNFLRQAVTQARMELWVKAVKSIQSQKQAYIQDSKTLTAINGLFAAREKTYASSISNSALESWQRRAEAEIKRALRGERRTKLINDLVSAAVTYRDRYQKLTTESDIDLSILARSTAHSWQSRNPRPHIRQAYYGTLAQMEFVGARDEYSRYMVQLTSPEVTKGGLVLPERVEAFVKNHDFSPRELGFSDKISPQLKEYLLKKASEARRKDVLDWLSFGKRFGFHKEYSDITPKVRELLTNSADWDEYVTAQRNFTSEAHPLLLTKIQDIPLFSLLADLKVDTPQGRAEAQALIDRALLVTRDKILSDIQKVARSNDLREIESVVTSSVMLQLVFGSYPEFSLSQEEFVETLLSQPFAQKLVHRYVGPTLTAGFGSLMLIHGVQWLIKPAAPFTKVILEKSAPFTEAFIKAALGMIVVDTASQIADVRASTERADAATDMSEGDVFQSTLVTPETAENARRLQMFEAGSLAFRVTLDTVFMYAPVGTQLTTALGKRLAMASYRSDFKAFARLGLKPGEWNALDSAYTDSLRNPALKAQDRVDIERAYRRLTDKLRSGNYWEITPTQSTAGRKPASVEVVPRRSIEFQPLVKEYLHSESVLDRQMLLSYIAVALDREANTPTYAADLRWLETFQRTHAERIFDLVLYLQLHWESKQDSFLRVQNASQMGGAQVGASIGILALGFTLLKQPQRLPTYLAFARHAFPIAGVAAGAASANAFQASPPPSPAHVLGLGFGISSGPENLLLDPEIAQFVSAATGIAASSVVIQAERWLQLARAANVAATPAKWNPYVLAGSVVLGFGVEAGAHAFIDYQTWAHHQNLLSDALKRMDSAFAAGDDFELYAAARAWTEATLTYSRFVSKALTGALEDYLKTLGEHPERADQAEQKLLEGLAHVDTQADPRYRPDLTEEDLSVWLNTAADPHKGQWGRNPLQVIFRGIAVLRSYQKPYLEFQVSLLSSILENEQAVISHAKIRSWGKI